MALGFGGTQSKSYIPLLFLANDLPPFSSSTAILDIGCGSGDLVFSLLSAYSESLLTSTRIIASDLSSGMISLCESRARDYYLGEGGKKGKAGQVECKLWDATDLSEVQDGEDQSCYFGRRTISYSRERDARIHPSFVGGRRSINDFYASYEVWLDFKDAEEIVRFLIGCMLFVPVLVHELGEEEKEYWVKGMVERVRRDFPDKNLTGISYVGSWPKTEEFFENRKSIFYA